MSRTLSWSLRARADLLEIGDYIALDDPAAAERWVARLIAATEKAARLPNACRRVPELARDDLREVLVRAYRIVFRVTATKVVVLTVFEGHRQLPAGIGEDR